MYCHKFILIFLYLFSSTFCEVTDEKKTKLLSDFVKYYNLRPNVVGHKASNGFLQSINEIDESTYQIEVNFTVHENGETKIMKCSTTVEDLDENGIAIVNNILDCTEVQPEPANDLNLSVESIETSLRKSVNLENDEIQADTAITSGEQFIAIPRDGPSAPCIGCSSYVNPQADGVGDLANLGVRHLDIHEPTYNHSLDSVIDVQRQVQVVNGIRYILTLSINFDNCTETNNCNTISKICKISILVKPWRTLPSGGKYRAILSNNCTEQWLFGDNGEVLPESSNNKDPKDENKQPTADDIIIEAKQYEDVQSQPNGAKSLTANELKALEEQIIPIERTHEQSIPMSEVSSDNNEVNKENFIETETTRQSSESSLRHSSSSNLSDDKKKAIDEMLDYLKFSGLTSRLGSQAEGNVPRIKRNYDSDLKLLSLTDDYRELKRSLENAKYLYRMAQSLVDYLNEMDIEIKNRVVKNVVKAEEEEDNEKHFIYIQVQVEIPCDSPSCDPIESTAKICNGVINSTNKENPQVLYGYCYVDSKEMEGLRKVKEIEPDDPVLQRLAKEVLKKIEVESTDPHAMKIKKISSANTRVGSGRLTKITMIINYTNCSKSLPPMSRTMCATLESLASQICEVLVHERKWLKERKITYTCTERPTDMIVAKNKLNENIEINDPKVKEILQDVLQYLELQSTLTNKQNIIKVTKISSQVIAGFLIKIEFLVGLTNCSSTDLKVQSNQCGLLKNERLRKCKAQVWDRSWIVDGKQMEVQCDEAAKKTEIIHTAKLQRSLSLHNKDNGVTWEGVGAKDNLRSKRQVPGGLADQDPNKPIYKQLAEESLQKYVVTSGTKQSLKVLRVDKVTTQVVAGTLTRISFAATETDNAQGNVMQCDSKILEQPWLNNKEIDVSCSGDQSRSKRKVFGGLDDQDPNKPIYKQLAEDSLQKYIVTSGTKRSLKVLRVDKVTTQVVKGFLTRINFTVVDTNNAQGDIRQCYSEILEFNNKEIDVSCSGEQSRSKRQVPGGLADQDPNKPIYKQLAEESLQKYIVTSGTKQSLKVLRVDKVTTQVVAGFLTRINFTVVDTDNAQGDIRQCYSKILEFNTKEIDVSCSGDQSRSKRQVPGGLADQDPNKPIYKQLAEESLQKYVVTSGTKQSLKVLRVDKVTTQVVAGTLTRISFAATETDNAQGNVMQCDSKILEQPWLNNKEIDVSCSGDQLRSKIKVFGGLDDQDPNKPIYKQLAEDSLQKYIVTSGTKQSLKVLRVDKVTTQVVKGFLTRINFTVVDTDNAQGDIRQCYSKILELNNKEIDVSCSGDQSRSKRQVPGGLADQDPNKPIYKQLAEESLQKYIVTSGTKQSLKVLRVDKVTTQVVVGFLTRITFTVVDTDNAQGDIRQCYSKILELNTKEIDVSCSGDQSRSKRQVPGGLADQDPNKPIYKQLAEESLQKYVVTSGTKQSLKVLRVYKVTTQVVAGTLVRISFAATETDNAQGNILQCNSKILEQPWLNNKAIEVSCSGDQSRSKRQITGGLLVQDPNKPIYKLLTEESLQKYMATSGTKLSLKVLRVDKVTTQVVSGVLTRISFAATEIDNAQGNILQCNSKILEQPWLNNKAIDVSCSGDQSRSKRQITGGLLEQDPNKPIYKLLAEESLKKYMATSGTKLSLKVLRVDKVTTQVVSGVLTRISFAATEIENAQGNILQCNSKILEQPWLNNKAIEVSCSGDQSRSKRQITGGLLVQDPNKSIYKLLAEESLQKYMATSGTKLSLKVLRVDKVTTQVVSGVLTRISFAATEIDNAQGNILQCNSKILEQPWLNNKAIDVTCSVDQSRSKRQITGGLLEQDPNKPIYKQLADESLQKYMAISGTNQSLKLLRVDKVTTQVVAGSLIRISFAAIETDNAQGDVMKCNSEILEQPWRNKKEITVSCTGDQSRLTRQVSGALVEQNPNKPIYKQLAEEPFQKYVAASGTVNL